MAVDLTGHQLLTLIAVARLCDKAYGVSVQQEIHDCAGRQISIPAVYAALDRLERLGLVRSWLSEARPERGGRARRQFSVTAAGRRRLEHERSAALDMWRGVPHRAGPR